MDLSQYNKISFEDLQKVSFLYEKTTQLICGTDTIHEDIIEFMIKPFADILKHHGVNLVEQDY